MGQFIVGAHRYVQMKATIGNSGENAYFTQMFISFSPIVDYKQFNLPYEKKEGGYLCFVDNPVAQHSEVSRGSWGFPVYL